MGVPLPVEPELKYSKAGPASTGSLNAFFQNESLTARCSRQVCLVVGMRTELELGMVSKAVLLFEATETDRKGAKVIRILRESIEKTKTRMQEGFESVKTINL